MSSEIFGLPKKPFRLAWMLGYTPLIFGTILFFGWKVTRQLIFPMFGPIALIAGFTMISAGLISLGIEWYTNRRLEEYSVKKVLPPLFLLLANFPVAAYYVLEGLADVTNDFAD